ncbi:MAG: DNA mismatch repair protein MutL [Fimbriimonadales bacterium]|nr:MAG: DNA mismatch repair protein MutL [Fimbriimonadales bacterium]
MPRVQLLDPQTINQIAAGEVVERPASVVKELIENALDAGARRIEITLRGAGKGWISVADDGCGMAAEDAKLALERHATSKIRSVDDLLQVTSLGFRGEALPSIASVSRMTLTTATEDGEGYRLQVEYGNVTAEEVVAARKGTEVRVERLFGNVPARLKFLKSDSTEAARVVELVSRYIVSFPEVGFTLRLGNEVALQSSGSGDLREALAAVWGTDLVSALAEVDMTVSDIRALGFVGPPHVNRHARTHQMLFVNRRPIRSKALYAAIDAAYRDLTPERRYAIVMLDLIVDPSEVDVNVSPTKTEVKFHREGAAFDTVRLAIKSALHHHGMMPSAANSLRVSAPEPSLLFRPASGGTATAVELAEVEPDLFRSQAPEPSQRMPFQELLEDLRVLGQVQNTFIVLSTRKGLALVDQHVAHERVLYEYLLGLKGKKTEVQRLLSPETAEFDKRVATALHPHLDLLREAGFELESFGATSFLVRGVPAGLKSRDYRPVLREIAEQLVETEGKAMPETIREKVLTTAACRMAVKAGDPLELPEMEKLIQDLATTENPYLCPHGRPIVLTLSWEELMRRFKRT